MSARYEVEIRGVLSVRHQAGLEGFKVSTIGEHTLLTGEIEDQAHLHAVIERLRRVGSEIVRIQEVADPAGGSP